MPHRGIFLLCGGWGAQISIDLWELTLQTNFGNALPMVESLFEDKLALIFTIYDLQP